MPGQSFHGILEGLARPTLFPALPQDTVPTLRAEWEANHAWSFHAWLHRGGRPFRDHQDAVAYPSGVSGNGFRWFLETGWRWR